MHGNQSLGRRRFLQGLGAGAAVSTTSLWTSPGLFAAQLDKKLLPTVATTEGPFYPDKMPLDTDNDLLIINDRITPAVGEITHLTGKILDARGKPVHEDGIQFWGQSFVAAPNGQVVQRASVDKEEIVVVPADLEQVEFSRTHWPFLRDRRIDAYENLTKRFVDAV